MYTWHLETFLSIQPLYGASTWGMKFIICINVLEASTPKDLRNLTYESMHLTLTINVLFTSKLNHLLRRHLLMLIPYSMLSSNGPESSPFASQKHFTFFLVNHQLSLKHLNRSNRWTFIFKVWNRNFFEWSSIKSQKKKKKEPPNVLLHKPTSNCRISSTLGFLDEQN